MAVESPVFFCACGEAFFREVWHCKNCDHHWPLERQDCWNCHEGRKPMTEQKAVNDPGPVRFHSDQPSYKVRVRRAGVSVWVWLHLDDRDRGVDPTDPEAVWGQAMALLADSQPAAVELFEIRCVRRWPEAGARGMEAQT